MSAQQTVTNDGAGADSKKRQRDEDASDSKRPTALLRAPPPGAATAGWPLLSQILVTLPKLTFSPLRKAPNGAPTIYFSPPTGSLQWQMCPKGEYRIAPYGMRAFVPRGASEKVKEDKKKENRQNFVINCSADDIPVLKSCDSYFIEQAQRLKKQFEFENLSDEQIADSYSSLCGAQDGQPAQIRSKVNCDQLEVLRENSQTRSLERVDASFLLNKRDVACVPFCSAGSIWKMNGQWGVTVVTHRIVLPHKVEQEDFASCWMGDDVRQGAHDGFPACTTEERQSFLSSSLA